MTKLQVYIADDQKLARESIAWVLSEFPQPVLTHQAASFIELVRAIRKHGGRELAIIDLKMPGIQDPHALGWLHHRYPNLKILALSEGESPMEIRAALDSGAKGLITKDSGSAVLAGAIRLVLRGERYLPASYVLGSAGASRAGALPRGLREWHSHRLSSRESQVLSYLAKGYSNRQIANRIGLQEPTVKAHVQGIFRKFGVSNRTQAVRAAYDLGAL